MYRFMDLEEFGYMIDWPIRSAMEWYSILRYGLSRALSHVYGLSGGVKHSKYAPGRNIYRRNHPGNTPFGRTDVRLAR